MSQTTYEILSVEKRDVTSSGHNWVIVTKKSDGTFHTFSFPYFTWAARSAEYGIPLSDITTLIDVCIHDAIEGIDENHPDFVLKNHEEHARTALFSRVADIKTRHLVVDPNNFLQVIVVHHERVPYADFHQKHKGRVHAIRKGTMS